MRLTSSKVVFLSFGSCKRETRNFVNVRTAPVTRIQPQNKFERVIEFTSFVRVFFPLDKWKYGALTSAVISLSYVVQKPNKNPGNNCSTFVAALRLLASKDASLCTKIKWPQELFLSHTMLASWTNLCPLSHGWGAIELRHNLDNTRTFVEICRILPLCASRFLELQVIVSSLGISAVKLLGGLAKTNTKGWTLPGHLGM